MAKRRIASVSEHRIKPNCRYAVRSSRQSRTLTATTTWMMIFHSDESELTQCSQQRSHLLVAVFVSFRVSCEESSRPVSAVALQLPLTKAPFATGGRASRATISELLAVCSLDFLPSMWTVTKLKHGSRS